MRGFVRSRAAMLVVAALAGCGPPIDHSALTIRPADPVSRVGQAIQGGTVDQSDQSVVAIMINTSQGIAICSGSLIAPNLVLSAHHCVADPRTMSCSSTAFGTTYSATSFAITTSYNAAASMFNANSFPTVNNTSWFGVSHVWTPNNNICGGDMSLLELASPITGVCPLIPRVDSAVSSSEAYTAVGFGITAPSGQSAGTRYTVSGLSVMCESNCGSGMSSTLEWEGGTSASKGTCEGDSGGPALDSARRVIGTVSRGPVNQCNDTVYESVFGNASWIKTQAQVAATDGLYAPAGWISGAATSNAASGYCGTGGGSGGGAGGGAGGGTAGGAGGGAGGGIAGGVGGGLAGGAGGGSAGGSGGGSSSGTCSDSTLVCTDASGAGDYACLDPTTSSGFPSSATRCYVTTDCPPNYDCWFAGSASTRGRCLENCSPGTGGGAGGGTGGGIAGGAGGGAGGGTGGGVAGGGSAGGAGGGTILQCDATTCPDGCCDAHGLCQAGTTASACGRGGVICSLCGSGQACTLQVCTGGSAGGSGGGTAGGTAGGTGGGTAGGGDFIGSTGGGSFSFGGGGGQVVGGKSGCGCTETSGEVGWVGLLGVALLATRRRWLFR